MAVRTAAETLLAGLAGKAFAEERPSAEVAVDVAAVSAGVVNIAVQAVKEKKLGVRGKQVCVFAEFAAFVHIGATICWTHMVNSCVRD